MTPALRTTLFASLLALSACGAGAASTGVPGDLVATDVETTEGELSTSAVATWFPMQYGNTWNLVSSSGSTRQIAISDTYQSTYAYVDGLTPGGQWLGVASAAGTTLYSYSFTTEGWSTLIRFSTLGTWQYETSGGSCGTYNVTGEKLSSYTTPAGTFSGVRSFTFNVKGGPTVRCAMPEISGLVFAPGVGVIAYTAGNGTVYKLKSAKVAGKTIPSSTPGTADVSSVVTTDKTIYTSQPNTIRCITTPCPSNEKAAEAKFTYVVTNRGTSSVTYQFSSGCQFNVELSDAAGRVVLNPIAVRSCIAALTNFTLQPGQSKTFTDTLELRDGSGELLNGTYTAKAYLMPRTASSAAAATATFKVKLAN